MVSKYVFTGPMRSGKSSLINTISNKLDVYKMAEVAQYTIDQEMSSKKSESDLIVPWNNSKFYDFQAKVFKTQLEWENDIDKKSSYDKAVLDRSLVDGLAYIQLAKFKGMKDYIGLYDQIADEAKNKKYSQVFMCAFIQMPRFDDKIRKDLDEATEISALLWDSYKKLGYSPIFIPAVSIEKRVELVLKYLN